MHSLLECGFQGKDCAREISVGKRTMRDPGAPRPNGVHIDRVDQVGMRQNRLTAQQSEAIETFGVGDAVTFEHVAMFPIAFRTMGLDMTVASLRQRAERLKGCVGTGRYKARRHYRLHKPRGV